MAWQDRPYYRDRGGSTGNPLMWLLSGSVPLFTAFGIRVRAHASLILFIVLVLVFGLGKGFGVQDRIESMAVLFCIILLHEFGHCFAARWVGGEAEDIMMTPLGGLAFAPQPRRPLPTFITVVGGPAVNVLICLISGAIFFALTKVLPWNPLRWTTIARHSDTWLSIISWTFWIYTISWLNLLFNLLPIFPLDGGRMLQTMLWPKFGYYKSMLFSATAGLAGAIVFGAIALATGTLLLLCVAIMGFIYCLQLRRQLVADGPYEQYDEPDYGLNAHAKESKRHRRRISRWVMRRARKRALADQAEQQHIDAILAKVSAHGMHSLTWFERRALRKATEHQRERDLEMSRERRET